MLLELLLAAELTCYDIKLTEREILITQASASDLMGVGRLTVTNRHDRELVGLEICSRPNTSKCIERRIEPGIEPGRQLSMPFWFEEGELDDARNARELRVQPIFRNCRPVY